jgi:hypothetical protein
MLLTQHFSRVRVAFSEGDLVEDIRHEMEEIAHRHGEAFTDGGEPQILLNTKTHEVWINCGDWHDTEVVRDIFDEIGELAGVSGVDGESESWPEGYNYGKGESDWQKIYP